MFLNPDNTEKFTQELDGTFYGIGAEILIACGVKKMKLLTNNPKKLIGLDGFGLKIVGREAIEIDSNSINKKYLATKRDKLGHLILGNNEK